MKLIIQIACYNEEETLAETLKALPKKLEGIDTIEILIINDGSTDQTLEVAKEHHVDHILSFKKNQGLARSFMAGLNECLKHGADIIVNTDGDNQYCADDIPKLIQPILEGKADMVVGARPISRIKHFSFTKKLMQKIGSWLVRRVSHTEVLDAPSGFRAITRNAALKLNVFNNFTYTHETIIQAGLKNMVIQNVPVRVNEVERPSRLFKSIPLYIIRSFIAILRMLVVYRPFRFFFTIGAIFLFAGLIFGSRYLYFLILGEGAGHIQSVILSGVLIGISFQMILVAFIADLLGVNRKLLEEVQYRLRKQDIKKESKNKKKKTGTHEKLFSDF
ncbi:MAG: glycosyltransferase family 2 protein [Candidatus Aminicenantes bacterium]|jgi:glycosyltransferase involved in cell wall biosynthesis